MEQNEKARPFSSASLSQTNESCLQNRSFHYATQNPPTHQDSPSFQPKKRDEVNTTRHKRPNALPIRNNRKTKKKHTTGGIPRWSPTLVLVARFSAYVWQSGRDAQFSLTYGRMCLAVPNNVIYHKVEPTNLISSLGQRSCVPSRSFPPCQGKKATDLAAVVGVKS